MVVFCCFTDFFFYSVGRLDVLEIFVGSLALQ